MKWRFLIVNLAYGEVKGTNNVYVAEDFRSRDDNIVIDTEKGTSYDTKGSQEIKEYDPEPRG